VILEAFAEYLQAADQKSSATDLLGRWLWEKLSTPPQSVVDKVLHCEISLSSSSKAISPLELENRSDKEVISDNKLVSKRKPNHVFKGNSASGAKLLKSLYEYCLSYEQQKWSRWVHSVKASDFKEWEKI
jgi:hypothetical protein